MGPVLFAALLAVGVFASILLLVILFGYRDTLLSDEDVGEIRPPKSSGELSSVEIETDLSKRSGSLPKDIPHRTWLAHGSPSNSVETWRELNGYDNLEDIKYIGPGRAEDIRGWLAERYPASKHAKSRDMASA